MSSSSSSSGASKSAPKSTQHLVRRGLMLVLSSPSGAGKTTITRRLMEHDKHLTMSISATTRPRRPGEVNGEDYQFVEVAEFNDMVDKGDMLEHAKVFGNYYGTPRKPVEAALSSGNDVIFDIDWQGTQQRSELAREDLVTIFILPPSRTELERRLRTRAQDTEEVINYRMARAADEMTHYQEYDYVLINEDIDVCLGQVKTILDTERMKRRRIVGLRNFVKTLIGGGEA